MKWQFNHAVAAFGRWVENRLEEKSKNGKPKNTIEELLGLPLESRVNIGDKSFM